jgi:NTE family protein
MASAPGPGGIGLALSGGAVRGIAHAGVLEVLVGEGIPVCAVAGTSAGAIVGALFASGMPPGEIARLALETRWADLLAVRLPRAGLLPGDGLQRFLERVLPVPTFADLKIPFVAVATDLETGERRDLGEGDLARAVLASCSVPVLLEPVTLGGRPLVDGGIASQVPVRALRGRSGSAPVVAVDVNLRGMEPPRLDTALHVALHLAMLWTARRAHEEASLADVLVGVDARGISLHDLSQGEESLRRGRDAARAALPAIRTLLRPKRRS